MAIIDLILPTGQSLVWHASLAKALETRGHTVQIHFGRAAPPPLGLRLVMAAERLAFSKGTVRLAASQSMAETEKPLPGELTIALAEGANSAPDVLSFAPNGRRPPLEHWASSVAAGVLPEIDVFCGNNCIAQGSPMLDNRVLVGRGLDDVLASATTLMISAVEAVLAGRRGPIPRRTANRTSLFLATYIASNVPRLVRELWRRRRFNQAHWRVGYRLHDGPGVAETATLGGPGWSVLPDDGARFYADPFAFEWDGERVIFVEEVEHAKGKAVISVSRIDGNGRALVPVPILEEPHHLSYPQVFARDGQVWMLPEASGGRELVLYRCARFPDRWERHAVLIADKSISDATLVEHDRCLWLLATDNSDGGSSSDTLVVYRADELTGPWEPHRKNPIKVDRRAARPGGAAIQSGGKLLIPLQDGTLGYGGGLGLAEIVRLSREEVLLGNPAAIETTGFWPYPQIHTLNRHGPLEVIDGIAAVPRSGRNASQG